MERRHPISTRTDTLLPYTTLCRYANEDHGLHVATPDNLSIARRGHLAGRASTAAAASVLQTEAAEANAAGAGRKPPTARVAFRVNGEPRQLELDTRTTLDRKSVV